jgi:2-keto-4-pentenoate hydratase
MTPDAISEAARLLVEARRSGTHLGGLPEALRPANVGDAHAIQDATVAALGETVAGWKVGAPKDGRVVRGVLLASRVFASPARIPAALVPLLGVEAEVAFRFDRALPPRATGYTYAEVADAVTAFVAIEVVDTRYASYKDAPLIERIADCVSNGAFVVGDVQPGWRSFDLAQLTVALVVDGVSTVRRAGGHPAGDPLLPAVALVNDLGGEGGVAAGRVMTTGTYTGLTFVKPGQAVDVAFEGFGAASVRFTV